MGLHSIVTLNKGGARPPRQRGRRLENVMTVYWVRFFDSSGRLAFAETIKCTNDEEAVAKAHTIHLDDTIEGYDVWEGKRLVTRMREKATQAK